MTMELLGYGNLPLTVIIKALPSISSFLGDTSESFLNKLGSNNKKLYSKLKVLQSGEFKRMLTNFTDVYKIVPEKNLVNVKNIDEDVRSLITSLYLSYKNKINTRESVEILVNLLIPKEKWIELHSSNLMKMISFYYNKSKHLKTTDDFEEFILLNSNYKKYFSVWTSKIKKYYEEYIFGKKYMRYEILLAFKYKEKYDKLITEIN